MKSVSHFQWLLVPPSEYLIKRVISPQFSVCSFWFVFCPQLNYYFYHSIKHIIILICQRYHLVLLYPSENQLTMLGKSVTITFIYCQLLFTRFLLLPHLPRQRYLFIRNIRKMFFNKMLLIWIQP